MRRGLAQYELTGAKLRCPYFLALLADQLGKAGRLDEAFEVIAKALTLAEQTGEKYRLSELHLIKGELFMKSGKLTYAGKLVSGSSGPSTLSQARACFAYALAIGAQQGARCWELKAALRMYRLDAMIGKPSHTQLAEVYSSFTEGFDTPDLKQAKALLEQPGRHSA